jgi:hypothetical protein
MNNRLLLAHVIIFYFTNTGIFVLKIVLIVAENFQRYNTMKIFKTKRV